VSSGELAEAICHYEKAIELSANYPERHNNMGIALSHLGRIEEAVGIIRRRSDSAPTTPKPTTIWRGDG